MISKMNNNNNNNNNIYLKSIIHKSSIDYHVTLLCEYFRDVGKKYVKPFYYQRPKIMKFLDLMASVSNKDRFRLLLILKVVLKCMQKHYDI